MNRKIVSLLKMLILSVGLIGVFSLVGELSDNNSDSGKEAGTTSYDFVMGTTISMTIYDKDVEESVIMDNIYESIKLLDEELISWRADDSELGRLNGNYAIGQGYQISQELYVILKQSLDICSYSEGALDITIRPLAGLWNIEGDVNEEFIPPSDEEIKAALKQVDYKAVELISETYSGDSGNVVAENYYVYMDSENMIIDLGATGKGYALDKAKAILEESKVDGALITVGGSILVYGEKSDGKPWRIGVRDPNKPNDTSAVIGYIQLPAGTKTCVSTSGGYEKYKTYQGKDYHHILDSKTGYPSDSGLLSVTVVCENGLASDGLSTACYVLGYERSLPLLEKYNAEAVFMDTKGNIMVTEGLKGSWVE